MSKAAATNTRKNVATHVLTRVLEALPDGMVVSPDATNPYAFVVESEGKTFRVIVKEK